MLTDAERWELRALLAEQRLAEMAAKVAEAKYTERAHQFAAAHGLDTTRPFRIEPDGRLIQDGA